MNGCPDDWWLDYTKDEEGNYLPPSSNELLMEISDANINRKLIPYIDKGVNRICWEIRYEQGHSVKYKWDDPELRSWGSCTLIANGKEVYKFRCSDLQYAMIRVQQLTETIRSHPYNFFNPEEDDGRKIYFQGLPAFVYKGYDLGEIKIRPDYSKISKEKWWELYNAYESTAYESIDSIFKDIDDHDTDLEYMRNDEINWGDALSDGKIKWFRD